MICTLHSTEICPIGVTETILWALAQRCTDMEKARREGYLEGLQEAREEAREEARKEGVEQILLALKERGVELPPDLLEELNRSRSK